MADPKTPISASNGVMVPLDQWAEQLVDLAIRRHAAHCPYQTVRDDHEARIRELDRRHWLLALKVTGLVGGLEAAAKAIEHFFLK